MLSLVQSPARADQAQFVQQADEAQSLGHSMAQALHPLSAASLLARCTVYPWIVSYVYSTTPGIGLNGLKVVQAPMHQPPRAEDLLPAGATLLREDTFPAMRFEGMRQDVRERYRNHYRAFLMWRRAHALQKPVEDLKPWAEYDAVLVDETVERWVHRGAVRFAGD